MSKRVGLDKCIIKGLDGKTVIKREGIECIKVFKKDEVVGVTTFRNKLIIATKKAIYQYPPGVKIKPNQKGE